MNPIPNEFEGTITKEDLANAGRYLDGCNCLIATMLKRVTGVKQVEEWVHGSVIAGRRYLHAPLGVAELCRGARPNQHYRSELIGRTIKFTTEPQ